MRPREFDEDAAADAIMRVFIEQGYAATSLDDLTRATGLSRSSIYNAFGAKHQMYELALRQYHKTTSTSVAILSRSGPVKDAIRAQMMAVVDDETSSKNSPGCLVAKSSLELAAHDKVVAILVAEHLARLENALAISIKRAQRNGEISKEKDSRALARFVTSSIQGLRVIAKGSAVRGRRGRLVDIVNVTIASL